MARIGITYLDVEKAALQLQGQGKLPTVDRVRNLLGTGSKTTIMEHLKRWKAGQADGQGKLPQELSALVTGLWERLQVQAQQRVDELQSVWDERIKVLQQALTKSQQEANQLKQKVHEAVEHSLQLVNEKQALEQQQQAQQQIQAQLQTRYAASQQQLEDLKTDNARLHQLANQVQANLEHYQQAMQSLRAEQSLEIEKREGNFQHELKALKQALSLAQQQSTALKEENQSHLYDNQQYQANINNLEKQVGLLTQQHQQASQDVVRLTEQSIHMKHGLQAQQEEISRYQANAKELERQVIVLSEQQQQLSTSLRQAEDKIEALQHEKLFLVQEKSELVGSLKQLKQTQDLKSREKSTSDSG